MNKSQEIITFGCRLNIYESEIIKNNLEKSGLENVAVFNTCAVIAQAEKQARLAIRKLKKENPRKYKDVVYKKKMERYDKAYKNYIDYKRSPRSWKDANPGKKAPRRPKRPRR